MRPMILLLEDQEVHALFIREMLETAGCDVFVAPDAPFALRAVEASAITACIVNVGFLEHDAEQLLRAIRLLRPIIPILLTTACDSLRYERCSAEDPHLIVLAKPYDEHQLVLTLRILIGERWPTKQDAYTDSVPDGIGCELAAPHLVFVDDSADDAAIAQWRISRAGLQFTWAAASSAAQLAVELGRIRPALIISDLEMLGFDGWEVLRISDRLAAGVPFIFHSGSMDDEVRAEAGARGVYGCVDKVMHGVFVSLVQKALHRPSMPSSLSHRRQY